MRGGGSDAVPVEARLVAGAVDLQRAAFADRVRADEDPVLPRGQAAEDARLHRLRAGKAQVRFHAGQRVGRHARALLERDADLVVPDRKSTRLNSSHSSISYAVFCLKKKKKK